ncbi:uncharacterized protein LOC143657335 [Tamandua tetradactyla]|uniref:uncharacterized protein LOC143657335 n=1 Tax=Tamandua tetradactyla TaxID=48850 RepID=UPI0040539458
MFSCCLPASRGRGSRKLHRESLIQQCRRWLSSHPRSFWHFPRRNPRISPQEASTELDDGVFNTSMTTALAGQSTQRDQNMLACEEQTPVVTEDTRQMQLILVDNILEELGHCLVPTPLGREFSATCSLRGNMTQGIAQQQVLHLILVTRPVHCPSSYVILRALTMGPKIEEAVPEAPVPPVLPRLPPAVPTAQLESTSTLDLGRAQELEPPFQTGPLGEAGASMEVALPLQHPGAAEEDPVFPSPTRPLLFFFMYYFIMVYIICPVLSM